MKLEPFVSIIVLNFNGKDYLEQCLYSVSKTNYQNFEVIIVDNASDDLSMNLAEATFRSDKRFKFFKNGTNLGYSGGNNIGFEYAKGDFVVLLNNDTITDKDWLTALLNSMEKDKTVGLAQSLLLGVNGEEIQTAGTLLSDYFIFKHYFCNDKPNNTKLPPVFETSLACGASMIVRREVLDEMGAFDPRLPFYYDDALLSLRTWIAGKRVVVVSESRVRHAGGINLIYDSYLANFNYSRAFLCLLFDVYFDLGSLTRAAFIVATSSLVNLAVLLGRNNFTVFAANARAIFWLFRNFKHVWANRLRHWSKAKITPAMLLARLIRIKLPTSVYLLPFKLTFRHYQFKLQDYERNFFRFDLPPES